MQQIKTERAIPPSPFSRATVYTDGVTVYTEVATVYTEVATVYTEVATVYTEGATVYTEGATVYTERVTVYTVGMKVCTEGVKNRYLPGRDINRKTKTVPRIFHSSLFDFAGFILNFKSQLIIC